MTNTSHPERSTVTVLQYETLYERDDERLELMRGRVVREPAPGGVHGKVLLALLQQLHAHVRAHSLGQVLVETGVRYPGEPHTVRRPDIAFIAASRLPPSVPLSFWEVVPDLAIEIVSPTDRAAAIQAKLEMDLLAGVRAVWVVDPRTRRVTVHTSQAAPQVVSAADTLAADDVVAGLVLRVSDLFDGLD